MDSYLENTAYGIISGFLMKTEKSNVTVESVEIRHVEITFATPYANYGVSGSLFYFLESIVYLNQFTISDFFLECTDDYTIVHGGVLLSLASDLYISNGSFLDLNFNYEIKEYIGGFLYSTGKIQMKYCQFENIQFQSQSPGYGPLTVALLSKESSFGDIQFHNCVFNSTYVIEGSSFYILILLLQNYQIL